MISIAARLGAYRPGPVRLLLAALLGAVCALAAGAAGLSRAQTAALSLPAAYAMMAVSCGRRAMKRPLRSTALMMSAAGLLGGVVLAFRGATGSAGGALALGAACTAVMACGAVREGRAGRDVQRLRVICRFRGREAAFEAIADSGNSLRDYLTHLPVIVIPEAEGRRKLGLKDAALRPIFADTAGGRIMMDCFMPEETVLETGSERIAVRAAAAFSPGLRAGAPALVPACLTGAAAQKTGK